MWLSCNKASYTKSRFGFEDDDNGRLAICPMGVPFMEKLVQDRCHQDTTGARCSAEPVQGCRPSVQLLPLERSTSLLSYVRLCDSLTQFFCHSNGLFMVNRRHSAHEALALSIYSYSYGYQERPLEQPVTIQGYHIGFSISVVECRSTLDLP